MLKKLAKRIDKEIRTAEDYVEQAFLIKHKSPSTAELFASFADEHLVHCEKLLKEGKRLIDTKYAGVASDSVKEADEAWMEKYKHIWEWEYRIAMESVVELRNKLSMYRNM